VRRRPPRWFVALGVGALVVLAPARTADAQTTPIDGGSSATTPSAAPSTTPAKPGEPIDTPPTAPLGDERTPAGGVEPIEPIDPIGTPTTIAGEPTVQEPAAPAEPVVDEIGVSITTPEETSSAVTLILLITVASIVPGLLLLCTTFPRFLIVLGLTRQALGLNTTPPNQVLAGLAGFLTLFVMAPTFSQINEVAIQPLIHEEISQSEAVSAGWEPLRDFMLERTRDGDLRLFVEMSGERPASPDDLPAQVLIPAFLISELRAAFLIGFLIWVPFLLIDLITSAVLSALGMMMMPPVVVSLPVKLALFVLVDGWALLIGSVVRSALPGR
jgi:flagellar biosynthetic protein FliP